MRHTSSALPTPLLQRLAVRFFVILLLSVAAPTAATAQENFGEAVTVEVVEIPVFVSRGDVSVSGLTKDDFELKVNGKRREIAYFDVMTFDQPRAADAPPIEVNRRRLFLLLFSLDGATYHTLSRALKAADEFVQEGSPRGDAFAVATFANGQMRFLVPFSNSEAAVRTALARLRPVAAAGATPRLMPEVTTRMSPAQSEAREKGVKPERSEDRLEKPAEEEVRVEQDAQFDGRPPRFEIKATKALERELATTAGNNLVDLLSGIADELQTLPGQKHVVLIAQRTDESLLRSNTPFVVRMHERFRAAGAFLHALGIEGMDIKGTVGNSALHTLALDTGGKVVQDTNRLEWGLGTIRDIQNVTYIIGYRPTATEAKRKRNDVRVNLKNKPYGTEVRYRKGFSAKAPDRELSRLYVAHVLANDVPHDEVGVDVFLQPKDGNLLVGARIDGKTITHAANGGKVTADVYLYVFDELGAVAGWSEKKVVVDFGKAGDFYLSEKLVATHEFTLGPGTYSAKAFVHFDTLQLSGFDRASFTVAERSASR